MAEIGPLTLSIVVNAQSVKELEQVVAQADDTFQQSNKEINSTLEKYTKIQIEIYKTQIEYLKKQEEVLKQLKQREGLEDLFDIALFARTGAPSSNLLLDLVDNLANSPKDLAISKQTLTNIAEILYLYSQITNLGEIVENKKINILGKIIELSPEEIEVYNEKLTQMKGRLEELDKENDQFFKEQQTISDPFQTLIFDSEEYRKKLEEIVKDLEQFNKIGGVVNVPLSDEESLIEAENILNRVKDQLKGSNEQFKLSMELTGVQAEGIGNLNQVYADFDKTLGATTVSQGKYTISIEDVIKNTSEGAVIFGFTKEELLGLRDATDEATKSTENLGENGFTAVKENVEQAGNKLGTLDTNLMNVADRNKDVVDSQEQVNQVVGESGVVYDGASKSVEAYGDTIEQVQNQGGFFEGIKQGFIDFVENVQSNSELMADFFADTLSQMSQNFSDLFFNIITGKFKDLADLAKQAFEAILRAFLDLVSAIATRQIVISIAGLFGVDTKGASAGDVLGIGKQAAGIGLDLAGVFGGGSGAAGSTAIAGGATSLGTGTVAIGSGLGGISSVGTGAAVGEMEYRLAA